MSDEATHSIVNSVAVGVVGSALTALSTWFWLGRAQAVKEADVLAAAQAALVARIQELETRERLAAAAFLPIASAFQATLIKSLTHEHAGELDALLVKVGDHTLTPAEEPRLLELLHERTTDMDPRISDQERRHAEIFPAVMLDARAEQLLLAAAQAAQLQPIVIVPGGDKP